MERLTSILASAAVFAGLAAVPVMSQQQYPNGNGSQAGPAGNRASDSNMGRERMPGNDTTATTTGTTMTPAPKAEEEIAKNPKLSSRLQSVLPQGTDVQQAATGFSSVKEFATTAHLSQNLAIPFDQLKMKVAGPKSEGLRKAVKELKPDADAKSEVNKAKQQAKEDIRESKKESKES